jgi:hypothetical protein
MTEQEIRIHVRRLLTEEDIPPDAPVDDEGEKEVKVIESNRKDEVIRTIRDTFRQIKLNNSVIDNYTKLYQNIHNNNEESQASFFNLLLKTIKEKFIFLFGLIPRDVKAAKLFEKDTIPLINDEFQKAYLEMKQKITS